MFEKGFEIKREGKWIWESLFSVKMHLAVFFLFSCILNVKIYVLFIRDIYCGSLRPFLTRQNELNTAVI